MLVTVALIALALKAPGDGGLVYEAGCTFFMSAPKGWVMDKLAGKDDNVSVVFYPKGGSWKDSATVMYCRVVSHTDQTFTQLLTHDVKAFQLKAKQGKVSGVAKIPLSDKLEMSVYKFLPGDTTPADIVGYIEIPKVFVVMVMTSHTPAELSKNYPAFTELAKSFRYLNKPAKLGS